MGRLSSYSQMLRIEVERVVDQAWRKISGLPALSRSQITTNLFLGGQYDSRGAAKLKAIGITAIVNLRTVDFIKSVKALGFHTLLLPTRDRHAPQISDLQKGIKFIDQELKSGGKVYIHCRAGEGRGATMAIAYLMSTGLTYADAFLVVKKVRTFIRPSNVQIEQLHKLEQILVSPT
jgi:dual specificity MAP kinase phosphatase